MTDRRTFLARLGAASALLTAGCLGDGAGTTETPEATPTATDTPTATPEQTETTGSNATAATSTTSTGGGRTVDVAAGPEGRLRFVPETVEIAVGDTVRWTFESPGHNVTAKAGASEKVSIPEGAEPFASYEGDRHFSVDEVGTTYSHTFPVPGEYVYVCAPHADQGMVGTVVVTE